MLIEKIVSGGQTGVDRAALDAAIRNNIPHGGWCPKGRLAENNTTIPEFYDLIETVESDVSIRTKLNIRDSSGTLILIPKWPNEIKDGTILTIDEAKIQKKPYYIVNLSAENNYHDIYSWIKENKISILNIAGPRESSSKGIYDKTFKFLDFLIKFVQNEMNFLNKTLQLKKSSGST